MSDTIESLRRKIGSAADLQSVVRAMKAMAATAISQYENAVRSLDGYDKTVQLGLAACFRGAAAEHAVQPQIPVKAGIGAIVFGSDQGLVGQFNESIVAHALNELQSMAGPKVIWSVGARLNARLEDAGLQVRRCFALPNSINGITPLVSHILVEIETLRHREGLEKVYLFHNEPKSAAVYNPATQRLLPLDAIWLRDITAIEWPTSNLPQVFDSRSETLSACLQEYFFVSLFRACAESLASENSSRLTAMQRAEENIEALLEGLNQNYHHQRQSSIDEEMFDLVAGSDTLICSA